MNKLERKNYCGVKCWSDYAPVESRAKCIRHRGSVIFPASQSSFRFVVQDNRIFYVSHFFLAINKQRILLWICWYSFIDPLWQFLIRGAFTEQPCLSNKCWHNIAGINGPMCLLLNLWWRLLISVDNYWSAVVFTNPLRWWQLLVVDVV